MPVVAFIVRTTCASARCCKCAGTFSRGRVSAAFVHFFAYASFYVTWQSVAVLNCAPSRAGGSRLVVDQTQVRPFSVVTAGGWEGWCCVRVADDCLPVIGSGASVNSLASAVHTHTHTHTHTFLC